MLNVHLIYHNHNYNSTPSTIAASLVFLLSSLSSRSSSLSSSLRISRGVGILTIIAVGHLDIPVRITVRSA